MKTMQCTHPPHHNGFVATCRLWTASGGVPVYIPTKVIDDLGMKKGLGR